MAKGNGLLYKYLPADLADVVFTKDNQVTLKFSKPKDFNDPYELFLATDFGGDPEMLACYAEAIGELPQYPTTCFSRSPIVIPMWAHYAYNHNGFVIEFSEESILEKFPETRFDNVYYQDGPSHDFSDLVARVLHIGKPRYTYFLQRAVINAAYFTKSTCWNYEQERRMVVGDEDIMVSGGLMLMNIPGTCVSSIICGARATYEAKTRLKEIAQRFSADFYELRIGRTSAVPYLVDRGGKAHSFIDAEIAPSKHICASCSEPIDKDEEECAWCQISDETKRAVAMRNPYRIIDHYGGLAEYIAGMDAISRASRKKK
jgi:predicted nucleic acid-binding Zn ribbon protein